MVHFQKALQINPESAEIHNNFGNALLQKGRVDEAIAQYQKTLQINPERVEVRNSLGSALLQKGSVDEAIAQYQTALQINPITPKPTTTLPMPCSNWARWTRRLLITNKRCKINPDYTEALNNLAWLLATGPDAHLRDGVQAVKYAGRACELTHYGVTPLVGTLAAAYAEAGRYDEAIAAAQKACALATAAGEEDLLERNQKLLVLYRAHQPYHEAAEKIVPAAP